MSAAKKRRPYQNSRIQEVSDRQESLRRVKMATEELKETLQKRILDNPKLAKKSALLISLWIQGGGKKQPPSKP
jgi:hypothetical protein